jgi:hypothetical protein
MIILSITVALAGSLSTCEQTWDASGLADAVASTDVYLAKMDAPGFLAARDVVLTRLRCVSEPLDRASIGDVHRVVAMGAYLEKSEARVAPALAGLLASDIGYQLPLDAYPEGHPIRELVPLASLLAKDTETRPLAVPGTGWIEVDGVHATEAPTRRAAVMQQLDGQGNVVETRYVWPDDDLGSWAPVPPASLFPPPPAVPGRRTHARLLAATGVSLAATAALYAGARASAAAFDDPTYRTRSELRRMQETTNGLTVGWVAAGVATVGLGVALGVTW